MPSHVRALTDIDRHDVALVGGKAAHLGELTRLKEVRVPAGFCVTTDAYRRAVDDHPDLDRLLHRLADPGAQGPGSIGAALREGLEGLALPDDLVAEVAAALTSLGEGPVAVRSSATAEDLPGTSFAGQQDSFLNVVGADAVLAHVRRCWGSLFTERAVAYRRRHGFDHRAARMAVVVQRMVTPQASGVLFTADPVTGNRRVSAIEATFGLGEALVAGRASADSFTVRDGAIVARAIANKQTEVVAAPGGGTVAQPVDPAEQAQPALTDEQVRELARLGEAIEAGLGGPQDIEWCLDATGFHIVQSRPITTLFPIPAADGQDAHVYLSVGHQQMMTDAMTPLGLSVWRLTSPRPMAVAGGRLFVDVTMLVANPASRPGFLALAGRSDPLIRDALETVIDRDGFLPVVPEGAPAPPPPVAPPPAEPPPPGLVAELIARNEASLAALRRAVVDVSGPAVVDLIRQDLPEMQRVLFDPQGMAVITTALEASAWLSERLEDWLGEKGVVDVLTQSVPDNVTSEMGLALLDVADAVRPHPAVVALLRDAEDDTFIDALAEVDGGTGARAAFDAFLHRYGMRCVGEIDITRPRWAEKPSALLPLVLSNVASFEPGEAARRFERGRQEAADREREVLQRLRRLPDGDARASAAKERIDQIRSFIGYREHPKYAMVSRYLVYKQALMAEADRLVRAGVLEDREDVFFLDLDELLDVLRSHEVDRDLIARRRDEHRHHQRLTPPRVLTSEGEAIDGSYRRTDLPAGALAGLAVSSGVVEGRARVVHELSQADLAPGDILVTPHTDPSWSPLFVTAAGLVTEVGGLMTHGSVVAREYGLPAVVGVRDATRLIEDGRWIRLDGTEGYVELLTREG